MDACTTNGCSVPATSFTGSSGTISFAPADKTISGVMLSSGMPFGTVTAIVLRSPSVISPFCPSIAKERMFASAERVFAKL